jgi:hypothetical protein
MNPLIRQSILPIAATAADRSNFDITSFSDYAIVAGASATYNFIACETVLVQAKKQRPQELPHEEATCHNDYAEFPMPKQPAR